MKIVNRLEIDRQKINPLTLFKVRKETTHIQCS